MIVRTILVVSAILVASDAAGATPVVVQSATPAAMAAGCAGERPDAVACAIILPPVDHSTRTITLKVELPPLRRCPAAQIVRFGEPERVGITVVDGANTLRGRRRPPCAPAATIPSWGNAAS